MAEQANYIISSKSPKILHNISTSSRVEYTFTSGQHTVGVIRTLCLMFYSVLQVPSVQKNCLKRIPQKSKSFHTNLSSCFHASQACLTNSMAISCSYPISQILYLH